MCHGVLGDFNYKLQLMIRQQDPREATRKIDGLYTRQREKYFKCIQYVIVVHVVYMCFLFLQTSHKKIHRPWNIIISRLRFFFL